MKFIVEYDLLPSTVMDRQLPVTRRKTVEADSIGDALSAVACLLCPGPDCARITIADIDGDLRE